MSDTAVILIVSKFPAFKNLKVQEDHHVSLHLTYMFIIITNTVAILRNVLILSSHLLLVIRECCLILKSYPTKIFYEFLIFFSRVTLPFSQSLI